MKKLDPRELKAQNDLKAREKSRQNDALRDYLRAGHSMPRTRREFLGSGIHAGFACLALPSLFQLIAQQANASTSELNSECSSLLQPSGSWIPYIQVVLGGGAALPASLLVLDSGRNLLSTYKNLGLGTTGNFTVENEFGKVPFAKKNGDYIGHLMRGLTSSAGAPVLAKTAMVKFFVKSQDDRVNKDGLMGLVMAAGRKGTDLPGLTTPSLVKVAAYDRPTNVQSVTSVDSFLSSLAPQGALNTYLADSSRRGTLMKLVRNLTASQRAKLDSSATSQTLGQLAECSSSKNIDMSSIDTSVFDARKNAAVAEIYGINSTTPSTHREALHATTVMNALNGRSGAARLSLGGYDYHGIDRVMTDSLDRDAGEIIGRILKTAHALQKAVFIHVTTDGSVETSSATEDSNFAADAGSRGAGCFMIYDPAGRRETTDSQIGHFNTSQAVDETWINTWTVDRCALAVFANYLQYHGQLSRLSTMHPGEFDIASLKKLVKVA